MQRSNGRLAVLDGQRGARVRLTRQGKEAPTIVHFYGALAAPAWRQGALPDDVDACTRLAQRRIGIELSDNRLRPGGNSPRGRIDTVIEIYPKKWVTPSKHKTDARVSLTLHAG